MADRHLEAAALALAGKPRCSCPDDWRQPTAKYCPEHSEGEWPPPYRVHETTEAVTAYLSSLLGELPEEAVEAACRAMEELFDGPWPRHVEVSVTAFLTALRDSLVSGRQGQNDG